MASKSFRLCVFRAGAGTGCLRDPLRIGANEGIERARLAAEPLDRRQGVRNRIVLVGGEGVSPGEESLALRLRRLGRGGHEQERAKSHGGETRGSRTVHSFIVHLKWDIVAAMKRRTLLKALGGGAALATLREQQASAQVARATRGMPSPKIKDVR